MLQREDVLIEADALRARLNDGNIRIYDATILFFRKESELTAHEMYRQGHIPGAAFFDHEDFSDGDSPYEYTIASGEKLAQQIGRLGIDAGSEVVVYADGILPAATRAWWILRYAGHNNVRVLNGGLAAWKQAGGALEQGEQRYEPTVFEAHLRPQMFVSKEEVQKAIDDGSAYVVHTLMRESYDQAHISGTSLSPCLNLMQEMETFRPQEEIVARLSEEAQQPRIITYCGGGIAATVNAMAHLIIGNENVAVYDGSMNEWVGEGLPITTGERA